MLLVSHSSNDIIIKLEVLIVPEDVQIYKYAFKITLAFYTNGF